jgi:hypothetical protein
MKEMFEASVDGKPYDPERWGQYFRPAGIAAPSASSTSAPVVDEEAAPAPVAPPKAAPAASSFDDEEAPAATAPVAKPAASGGQNAQDILAMIRARQNKQ